MHMTSIGVYYVVTIHLFLYYLLLAVERTQGVETVNGHVALAITLLLGPVSKARISSYLQIGPHALSLPRFSCYYMVGRNVL